MDEFPIVPEDSGDRRVAQHGSAPSDRIEHRLNVGRRTGDDPEDIARRRLLLKRLLRLVEQSYVLDGDHGLIGEGPQKLDVRIRERVDLWMRKADDPNDVVFPPNRNRYQASRPVRPKLR